MPTLTFPLASLPPMVAGGKRCTVRFDARLARLRPGDPVTLNFGARNRPTVRKATVSRVEVMDLAPFLEKLIAAPDEEPYLFGLIVGDEEAARIEDGERRHPLAPQAEWERLLVRLGAGPGLARALAEACRDSGNVPGDVLLEADDRDRPTAVAVWMRLEP